MLLFHILNWALEQFKLGLSYFHLQCHSSKQSAGFQGLFVCVQPVSDMALPLCLLGGLI